MRLEEAQTNCADAVRRHDPDRYLAGLFVPADTRPLIFALYAFNCEIARLGERSREPMLAAVRLQWWRETVEEAAEGRARAHPVAISLADLFARFSLSMELFAGMLDAREFDIGQETFADLGALETYCEATSASLMQIAAQALGVRADDYLRHAGIAYALAGLLRSVPFHAARRKLYMPLDFLTAEALDPEAVYSGSNGEALARVQRRLAARAREHLALANAIRAPRGARIIALPAALVRPQSRLLTRCANPFRQPLEVPVYRRQLALLRATISGRL